jgi:hypothetical protein
VEIDIFRLYDIQERVKKTIYLDAFEERFIFLAAF